MAGLESIRITLDGIGHVLADRQLAVPVHQRAYAWEDKQVLELFQDVGDAQRNRAREYFLGTIVLANAEDQTLNVVDGQQRLATTSILFAAIRNYFGSIGDQGRVESLQRYLYHRDLRTQEMVPRITLNEGDHQFYLDRILKNPAGTMTPAVDSHWKLLRAFELANEHVSSVVKSTKDPTNLLIDWIGYFDAQAKIIVVQVPDDTNAFTIFETLNDRGLDLATTDLIKNYLFHKSSDRLQEVKSAWVAMQGVLDTADLEGQMAAFIRHLWSSKYGVTRERDLYREIKAKITSRQAAIDFSQELKSESRTYAALLSSSHEFWNKYGTTTAQQVASINQLRFAQVRPLLLAVLRRFSVTEAKKSIAAVVSWTVRFMVSGGGGSGLLEQNFSDAARAVNAGDIKSTSSLVARMRGVVPSDERFQADFSVARVTKNYLARYYLRALEHQRKGLRSLELIVNPNEEDVNLEHVLPQNPGTGWDHVDEEARLANTKRIGNLTILSKEINDDLENKSFDEKRKIYKNSQIGLTTEIANFKHWGSAEIADRQKTLAELAVKAWPISP